jgi:hypothetical protein
MGFLFCAGNIGATDFGPQFVQVMSVGGVKQIFLSPTVNSSEDNAACVRMSNGDFSCLGDGTRAGLPQTSVFTEYRIGMPVQHLATGTWDQACAVVDGGPVICSTPATGPMMVGTATRSFWVGPDGQYHFDEPGVFRASSGRTEALVTAAGLQTAFGSFGIAGRVVDGYIDGMMSRTCWLESNGHVICRDLIGPMPMPMPAGPPPPAYDIFGGGVLAMAADGYSNNICAVKRNGTLWCMGTNARGQLGTGSYTSVGMPTPIPIPSPFALFCQ